MGFQSDGSELIRKPHIKTAYTDKELEDFVKCVDPEKGIYYFISNFFWIQHPVQGKIQYQPYDFQKELIHNYHEYRFSINMLSRQTGKTTTAAGYLLWYAMFSPDKTILVAAHKYDGAQEIMQRVRFAYESCPDHVRAGVTSYNKGSIEFDNGSRIISQTTTETTGRGLSISLLYCDEFAYVRPNIAAEFWTSISPTLSTGGNAIITSTPNSDEDQFALIWKGANKCEDEFGNETKLGVNGFKAYKSIWHDHPDRDIKWADEEKGRIGEERFRREHLCEFIINDETLINASKLFDLEGIDPLYKNGQVRWFKKPEKGKIYCIALDPSLGTGGDPSAIQVFEANTTTQVAEWRHNKTPIPVQIRIMHEIITYINDIIDDSTSIYYSLENNTLGEAALISLAEFGEDRFPGMLLSEGKRAGHVRSYRKGYTTTNKSKLSACAKLKTLVETGKMTVNSRSLISEFKTFVAIGTTYAAKPGSTDDLVMSTVLIVRMLQTLQNYHTDLDNQIRDYDDFTVEPMPFILF